MILFLFINGLYRKFVKDVHKCAIILCYSLGKEWKNEEAEQVWKP